MGTPAAGVLDDHRDRDPRLLQGREGHEEGVVTQPRGEKFKKAFWEAEVTKMINVYGAPIDKADIPKIVEYLTANY